MIVPALQLRLTYPIPIYAWTEELPVRLAHRAKELDELPHNLSSMPSIQKVKNWYAQSFEVRQHNPLGPIVHLDQNRSYHASGTYQFPSHLSPARYPHRVESWRHLTPRFDSKPIC
jgi:hypothetical protein